MATHLSLADARRLALRAQGFGTPMQATSVPPLSDRTRVTRIVEKLGAIQIDAVNVLVRSHYLQLFSRLSAYDTGDLDRAVFEHARAFEGMAHAASIVPISLYPSLRWRMDEFAGNKHWVAFRESLERRNRGYFNRVLQEVAERGPLSFRDLRDPSRHPRPQTKYAESSLLWEPRLPSDGKTVLDGLWKEGRLAVAGRGPAFERIFDLAERVLPVELLGAAAPDRSDAHARLVRHAAQALGIGWLKDVAGYFGLSLSATRRAIAALLESGLLIEARVEGVDEPAFLDPAAAASPVEARALLGPFDSLLWERTRNVRLFGFRHSFEIYVPESKRRYGYYVLPFLFGEAIVARVDLKADRPRQTLLVQAAFAEPSADTTVVIPALAQELDRLATWLAMERVVVADRGDLAPALSKALHGRSD